MSRAFFGAGFDRGGGAKSLALHCRRPWGKPRANDDRPPLRNCTDAERNARMMTDGNRSVDSPAARTPARCPGRDPARRFARRAKGGGGKLLITLFTGWPEDRDAAIQLARQLAMDWASRSADTAAGRVEGRARLAHPRRAGRDPVAGTGYGLVGETVGRHRAGEPATTETRGSDAHGARRRPSSYAPAQRLWECAANTPTLVLEGKIRTRNSWLATASTTRSSATPGDLTPSPVREPGR